MMAAQWPPVNVQAYTGLPHQQSPRHSRPPDTLGQRPAHPENTPSAVPCSPSVTQKHTHIHIVSPSVNNSLLLIYQCWSIEIHGHTYRQSVGRQPFTAHLSILVNLQVTAYISVWRSAKRFPDVLPTAVLVSCIVFSVQDSLSLSLSLVKDGEYGGGGYTYFQV